MLRFIFGRALSGKTSRIFSEIAHNTQNENKDCILIVPEQTTFDRERELLHILGDGNYTAVPVLSFNRMFDEIGRICGGIASKRLGDCGRIILMAKAAAEVKSELTYFGNYTSDKAFIKELLSTVDEFKRFAVSCDDVLEFAKNQKGVLKSKLCDISLLYRAYDSLVADGKSDPSDDLKKTEGFLNEYAYFSEKDVYFDSFKNFTGAQLKIIEQIIRQADNVTFAFTFDKSVSGDGQLFSAVNKTVEKIKQIAEKYGVETAEDTVLNESYYQSSQINKLERLLSVESNIKSDEKMDDITVCRAYDIYSETEFCFNEIRRLVRSFGYRYKDFCVIARNEEQYRTAVTAMSEKYNVPCYYDKTVSVIQMPFAVFLMNAVKYAVSPTSEGILSLLKTGVLGVDFEDICLIENYVYMWNIKGDAWKTQWDMRPSGFENPKPDDEDKLKKINDIRASVIGPLVKFRSQFNGGGANMAKMLWEYSESVNASEGLKQIAANSDYDEAEQNRLSYGAICKVLDDLSENLGDDTVSAKEFYEYFRLSLSSALIGDIPRMLDEVTFGSADRIRPTDIKIVFVLGLNNGVFPALPKTKGLLAERERSRLLSSGMPLNDTAALFATEEEYLLYTSICLATDRVYLSYSEHDSQLSSLMPSAVIDKVIMAFSGINKELSAEHGMETERIETPASAFIPKVIDSANARELFDGYAPFDSRLDAINRIKNNENQHLSPALSEKLFGRDMVLSATGIEKYNKCPFSYFCGKGLNINAPKTAQIDVSKRGTIVHYVLEKIVGRYNTEIKTVTDDILKEEVNACIEEYLSDIKGIEKIRDARFESIIESIKELSVELVLHIRDEFAQSRFEPIGCELKIGNTQDSDITSIPIKTPLGSVTFYGYVDRADRYGEYIRVVDYKTGKKEFKCSEVLYGLNMQMIIYLYVILHSPEYKGKLPAGVLYLDANKDIEKENNYVMNGLINDNSQVVDAMEPLDEGKYIPQKRITKNGGYAAIEQTYFDTDTFNKIFYKLEKHIKDMNCRLLSGDIAVDPLDTSGHGACDYCDFKSVCGIENKPHKKAVNYRNRQDLIVKLEEEENV